MDLGVFGSISFDLKFLTSLFSIVIIDLNMPQIDGEETLNELRKIDPAVRTIIASGYSESELNMRFLNRENLVYIQKPFSLSELSEVLKSIG